MDVKVWNDNTIDFKQEYRGKNYFIPAGEFIVLEEQEAYEFRGAYFPIQKDGGGVQTRESYKMIRLEMPKKPGPKPGAKKAEAAEETTQER